MYLCFLDESGNTIIPKLSRKPLDPSDNIFTFSAFIIHDESWHGIREVMTSTKERFRIPLNEELKWKHLMRRSGPASHLSKLQVLKFANMLVDKVRLYRPTGIAVVIFKDESYKHSCSSGRPYIHDQDDIYYTAFRYCLQRLALFLYDHRSENERAIVIADNRDSKSDNRLRRYFEAMVYGNERFVFKGDLSSVVEGLFLQVSHYSVGVQLADFLAGAFYQEYAKGNDEYAQIFQPIMRRAPSGDKVLGYGIVEVPSRTHR